MTQKKALERCETKLANTEATPQATWPLAKSLINRDGPRASTDIHGPLGIQFRQLEKANAITGCLEKQFTHYLCEENHERPLEARVQALLKAVDSDPPERIRPYDLQKLINSLKLRKACGIHGIPNE
jgi:hypothetical protein